MTTFSSFEYESYSLIRGGGSWLALVNLLGSVICGLFAVWLGSVLACRHDTPFAQGFGVFERLSPACSPIIRVLKKNLDAGISLRRLGVYC